VLSLLGSVLTWLLGLIWPAKDQREDDRKAGFSHGVAEANNAVTNKDLNDAQKAVDAGRVAIAVDDAGGVREPHAGDRKWNPNDIG
jgi:hypothetical protein